MIPGKIRVGIRVLVIASIIASTIPRSVDAAFVYKNYIVKQTGGIEVLCDPYIVRPNDHLYKIFRRKGEIAEGDYPQFQKLFQRLNPHIADINIIVPGQFIFIPLKIIDKNTFSEQSSGVVTIPYVTVSNVRKRLEPFLKPYKVKNGDFVSKLISDDFGPFGSENYQRGATLFKLANPQIKDLNRIYPGQDIYLVDPDASNAVLIDPTDDNRPTAIAALGEKPPPPKPPKESRTSFRTLLEGAVEWTGGRLKQNGIYYFPVKGRQRDVRLDLRDNPLLEIGGRSFLFSGNGIDEEKLRAVSAHWPDVRMISPADLRQPHTLLDKIFSGEGKNGAIKRFTIENAGVRTEIRARWIFDRSDSTKQGKRLCINTIRHPDERTPRPIVDYLEDSGIVLKEFIANPLADVRDTASGLPMTGIGKSRLISVDDNRRAVQILADALGYRFYQDVEIGFDYGRLRITGRTCMLSKNGRRPLVVDFGTFYGEAAEAIRKQGFDVVSIDSGLSPPAAVKQVLDGLSAAYDSDPSFKAAQRGSVYNTFLQVSGIWLSDARDAPMLWPSSPLDARIVSFLNDRDITVVVTDAGNIFKVEK